MGLAPKVECRFVDDLETGAVRAILTESFPADEVSDADEVVLGVTSGSRQCVAAFDGPELVGFGTLLPLDSGQAVLLEYLAVAAAHRNRGIGAQLVERMPSDLVIEVDPPDAASGDERTLRTRRIGFYERTGASLVPGALAYRVPRDRGEGTLPYLLMWRGTPMIRGERLRDVVSSILVQSYGVTPGDALHRENLAALTG